jgi:hypothetical protein
MTGIERLFDVLGSILKGGRYACSSSQEGYRIFPVWLNARATSPSAA